ncbi:MAG: hypothetical protein AB1595_00865 [bacterium]
MQAVVELTEDVIKDVSKLGRQFGFRDEREFIEDAVREKLLQLKKRLFVSVTDEIRMGLEKKGISLDEVLEDFERQRK